MDVLEDKTATLRAEARHPFVVMEAAGFCTEHSAKSRSIGYEEETSPTLRAGVVPAALAVENHPTDSRVKLSEDGVIQTITERCGTGGGNVPLLMEQKVYGVCSKNSNSMKSDNPNSGFYEAETTRTLDANGGRPDCAQGGMVVVCVDQGGGKSSVNVAEGLAPTLATSHGGEPVIAFAQNQREEVRDLDGKAGALAAEPGIHQQTFVLQGSMIGRADKNGPQGSGINEDVCFTLDGADRHAVATPVWSTSKNSHHTYAEADRVNTLVATDYKDPPTVTEFPYYIVRRLTPTECARLQGFPDWWCSDLGTENPTDEEIAFWKNVFETHRALVTHASKPKTEKQIIKWLKNPASDSAEYRLWGNGIFEANAFFVLSGIVWADGLEDGNEDSDH